MRVAVDTADLYDGIRAGLKETISKQSAVLGRSVDFDKSSSIAEFPPYLCVNFVRFFWKAKEQVKAKILKVGRGGSVQCLIIAEGQVPPDPRSLAVLQKCHCYQQQRVRADQHSDAHGPIGRLGTLHWLGKGPAGQYADS